VARKKLDPAEAAERAAAAYRRLAEELAAKRGMRGVKAQRWIDSFVEATLLARDAGLRRAAGEAEPPEVEEWLYAEAPTRPDVVDLSKSGKWLVFCSLPYFDEVWEKLRRATEAGQLGFETKIRNPANPLARGEGSLVACVYTPDFEDEGDVRRVLRALRDLGFVNASLQYKRDADTLAGQYGDGVSVYVSPSGTRDVEPLQPAE
jgi:hypothetical protein